MLFLSATVESQLLLPEHFYSTCSQFNDVQKHFFSLIMIYIMECKTSFKNKGENPEPFFAHLTG